MLFLTYKETEQIDQNRHAKLQYPYEELHTLLEMCITNLLQQLSGGKEMTRGSKALIILARK